MRWTGTFDFSNVAYLFTIRTDDGMRLYIDKTLVIDAWTNQSSTAREYVAGVLAGRHEIIVEYFENEGVATAQASWRPILEAAQSAERGVATPVAPLATGTATPRATVPVTPTSTSTPTATTTPTVTATPIREAVATTTPTPLVAQPTATPAAAGALPG